MGLKSAFILVCISSFSIFAFGEDGDSTKKDKPKLNIIKLNLSSNALYRLPLIEYERIVKKNQSFSVQVGAVELPFGSDFISNTLQLTSTKDKSGFTITGDYRFYLPKENKDLAPHGVYIGPYISYYGFKNTNTLKITDSNNTVHDIVLGTNLDVLNVGFQLGYQFLLGKRWTIDCILLGPSIANYKVKMAMTGDLTNIDVNDTLEALITKLASKYPAIQSLLGNQLVEFKGSSDSWNGGFRYSIHVGYRF